VVSISPVLYSLIYNAYELSSFSVSTIKFTPSVHNVNEDDGKVDITLHHSNPSSIDITLIVNTNSVTASGE